MGAGSTCRSREVSDGVGALYTALGSMIYKDNDLAMVQKPEVSLAERSDPSECEAPSEASSEDCTGL